MAEKEHIEREVTCRDCFHYDACFYHITEETKRLTVNECPLFVNKADVVEVVRCKDCAYANEDGTRCHYWVGRETDPMGYCHKGAKMDGKGDTDG